MGTMNEDMNRVLATMRSITDHDVSVHGAPYWRIDINFAHNEAVVIQPDFTQFGLRWSVDALAWDRTGGVSAERHLGVVNERYLPAVVREFLREQAEMERRLEEILSGQPDD